MSELWQYDNYRTSNILLYNTTIIEYDLKSANTSVAKEYNLLPKDFIRELEACSKRTREVRHGLYKREHKEYNELEKTAFAAARKLFFDMNNLEDNRVVAIKKDALFVEGICEKTQLTENLNFRKKNEYDAYMFLKPFELYYSGISKPIDIKQMNTEVYLTFHSDYFGSFIAGIFRMLEVGERRDALKFIRTYYDKYKRLELDPEHYREFTAVSKYRYKDGLMYDICIDKELLDIRTNASVIMTLCQILL